MPSRRHAARLFFCFCVSLLATVQAAVAGQPNVLFIAVDDLRPQLNCYGQTQMVSPNIDRLAREGVLFERAYCMVPTCGASRASLMTSVRPTAQRFTSYLAWAEKEAPAAVPLHTHFKNQGYQTVSLGKVFHHRTDHLEGWSVPPWRSSKSGYQDRQAQIAATAENRKQWPQKNKHRALPYESYDAPDEAYPDGDCAQEAVRRLRLLAESPDQPFFMAVGFLKPHLPFNAPQRYWDLYDFDDIQVPDNYHAPQDAPSGAVHNSGELRAYAGIHPRNPVDPKTARRLIHGYYACVSFTDAQVGKLLDAVQQLGLQDNTIIVLWGDHGWQLGEHGMWNKHSCFETSMHAPLIVSAPPSVDPLVQRGVRTPALVEFIDVYPTLCQLAGLTPPETVQGTSAVPLMRDPKLLGKPFAIGRFGRGDTIRSNLFRFSEYRTRQGDWTGNMLYRHDVDPGENTNISSANQEIVQDLARELDQRKGR